MLRTTATREVKKQGEHTADVEPKIIAQIAGEGGNWELKTVKMFSNY